ncbi:MAG: [FeFe] hydrogenase H-cluster radical SAM maturase HydE [Cellulosilyticaceae bacterium]
MLGGTLESFEVIRQEAMRKTERCFGNKVYVRGLVEFSNYCRCSCLYCGLRIENRELVRFRLKPEAILEITKNAYNCGYRSFVWQSGEDPYYTEDMLVDLVKSAKQIGDLAVTLSIGERPLEEYIAFKEAGVDRFLIKHECSDSHIYNSLHPHSSYEARIRCLWQLKQLGYQVGSGFMIGLPCQTIDTITKDLELLKEIGVHMAGIGPFIPHEQTPLGHTVHGSTVLTLQAVALARLMLPECMLPVTTSLGVIDSEMKNKCLQYGANVVMQKLEPIHLRKLYTLYPKEVIESGTLAEEKQELINWLKTQGKEAMFERGDHPQFKKDK